MFRSSLSGFAVLGSLISFVCSTAAVFAEDFPVGAKVDASPYSNTWSSATITGTVQGGYTVKMDAANGFKKDEEYVVPAYRVRGASAAGGTANGAAGSAAGSAGSDTASTGSTSGGGAPFGAVGNESFTVGTKIDASPYTDKWSSATITGRVPGGYVVKMDAGNGWKQDEEFVVPYSRARNLTSHAGAAGANAQGGLGANGVT